MAIFEIAGYAPAEDHQEARDGLFGAVRARIRTVIRHQEEKRTIARIARFSPHLIRDMGLEPAAVYGALEDTWDEVPGARWRGLEGRR